MPKEELLAAIAKILTVSHWKTSIVISSELKLQYSFDISPSRLRPLLRAQSFVERKKFSGYRLKSKRPDYFEWTILDSIKSGSSGAAIARTLGVSRQAVSQRKRKLLKEEEICP